MWLYKPGKDKKKYTVNQKQVRDQLIVYVKN